MVCATGKGRAEAEDGQVEGEFEDAVVGVDQREAKAELERLDEVDLVLQGLAVQRHLTYSGDLDVGVDFQAVEATDFAGRAQPYGVAEGRWLLRLYQPGKHLGEQTIGDGRQQIIEGEFIDGARVD